MEIFKTKRNGEACSFQGYCYRINRCTNDTKFWRCLISGCKGRLVSLLDNSNPAEHGDHCHLPNPEEAKVKLAVSQMKERAKNESTSMPLIHLEACKIVV